MNIGEAIELLHRIEGKELSKELVISKNLWCRHITFKFDIHAEQKSLSQIMAMIVKETGVKLTKSLYENWQNASGSVDNAYFSFFPRGNVFVGCKIVKKKRLVTVPAKPAVEKHDEVKVYYEVVCKNGEEEK